MKTSMGAYFSVMEIFLYLTLTDFDKGTAFGFEDEWRNILLLSNERIPPRSWLSLSQFLNCQKGTSYRVFVGGK